MRLIESWKNRGIECNNAMSSKKTDQGNQGTGQKLVEVDTGDKRQAGFGLREERIGLDRVAGEFELADWVLGGRGKPGRGKEVQGAALCVRVPVCGSQFGSSGSSQDLPGGIAQLGSTRPGPPEAGKGVQWPEPANTDGTWGLDELDSTCPPCNGYERPCALMCYRCCTLWLGFDEEAGLFLSLMSRDFEVRSTFAVSTELDAAPFQETLAAQRIHRSPVLETVSHRPLFLDVLLEILTMQYRNSWCSSSG